MLIQPAPNSFLVSVLDARLIAFTKKWMQTVSRYKQRLGLHSSIYFVRTWALIENESRIFQVGGLEQGGMSDKIWWNPINQKEWNTAEYSYRWEVGNASAKEYKRWYLNPLEEEPFSKALKTCQNCFTERRKSISNIIVEPDEEVLKAAMYAHVLQIIMNNFTYALNITHACEYPGVTVRKGVSWYFFHNGFERSRFAKRYHGSESPALPIIRFTEGGAACIQSVFTLKKFSVSYQY